MRQQEHAGINFDGNPMITHEIMKIVAFGQFLFVLAAELYPAAPVFDAISTKIINRIVTLIQMRQQDRVLINFDGDLMITHKKFIIVAFG